MKIISEDTRAARIRGGGRRGGGSRGSGGWFGSSSGSKGTSSNTGNRGSGDISNQCYKYKIYN